jgi:hypothetical protein
MTSPRCAVSKVGFDFLDRRRVPSSKVELSKIGTAILLPLGEGGAAAPDEGSPPHDLADCYRSWGGLPSPGAIAPPSPGGRGNPPQ